jgi:hypothetical protein
MLSQTMIIAVFREIIINFSDLPVLLLKNETMLLNQNDIITSKHPARTKLKIKLKFQVITEIVLETFCSKNIEISYVHNVEQIQIQLNS